MLQLPSGLKEEALRNSAPKNGSLAAMLAALWEGRAGAVKCGSLGNLAATLRNTS